MRRSVFVFCMFMGMISISCAKFELDKTSNLVIASGTRSVVIKWAPSKEKAVNSTGGGYKVLYGLGSIDATSKTIDIPFQPGSAFAPQASIKFPSAGNYKIRITAYSALNPQGSSTEVTTNVQ